MTKAERDALRELEKAATPGPWGNNCGDIENKIAHPNIEDAPLDFYPGNVAVALRGYDGCGFQRAPDEDLAVAARNALVPLLDLADEADRLREDMQRIIDGTLLHLGEEREWRAANKHEPDPLDRAVALARHDGAIEQLEFLLSALRGIVDRSDGKLRIAAAEGR